MGSEKDRTISSLLFREVHLQHLFEKRSHSNKKIGYIDKTRATCLLLDFSSYLG